MKPITALPALTLAVADQPLPPAALTALTHVLVQQRLSLPTQLVLTFSAPPGPLDALATVAVGSRLRLLVAGHLIPLFVGQVTAIEDHYLPTGQRQLVVRGYDLLHTLRKRQTVRAHVQVTPGELAQELVADLGLTVATPTAGPVWPRLIQPTSNDFELLRMLLARSGLYCTLRDTTLHLLTLAGIESDFAATPSLVLGDTLHEARFVVNGAEDVQAVNAAGWNALAVETFTSTRTEGRSGQATLAGIAPDALGGHAERWLFDESAAHDEHIEGLAQAELDYRQATAVTFWGIAQGNPALQPGTSVTVTGVAESVAGRYSLTEVTHTIDAHLGFVSEVQTAPPPPLVRPHATIATLGVVTAVDDSEGMGRVRVLLPTYHNLETDWLQVLSPAAGVNKGLVALPNVNDNVLVLLPHGDPASGVILGAFYGPYAPYDPGVEGNAVRRYSLRTPAGQLIRLDDQQQTIHLENSNGSYVTLTPSKVQLHATADLELSAPGKAVVIRGRSIDFREA